MKMEKKRSSNFSTFETNLLIKLVEDKKHVLDPHKLNAASLNLKHGAWQIITENFNNHSQIKTHRDEKALKKKYSNLKCDAKNWPALRAEALMKLSKPESYEISYQLKREKVEDPAANVDSEPFNETVPIEDLKEADHHTNDEVPILKMETTETEASADDADSSTRKRYQYLDEKSERTLQILAEKRVKLSEEEAKVKIEILETEHREQMRFLQLKHDMAMKRLELEQERCKLELDFLRAEVAMKKKLFRHRLKCQVDSNENSSS